MARESAAFIATSVDGKRGVKDIKRELDSLHGVTSVSVNPKSDLVYVDYDSSGVSYDKIENRLNKMGYQIAADASEIRTR